MKESAQKYYTILSRGYRTAIRQLVPRYDDMTNQTLAVLRVFAPRRILDVGAGDGSLTRRILEELPAVSVVAIEPCYDMVQVARAELAPFGARCSLQQHDVAAFEPAEPFGAVHSNLVLHNVEAGAKVDVLRRMSSWLEPHGVVVWGDLVRLPEPRIQDHFVAERVRFALDQGCAEPVVRENFAKEAAEDHPWTITEMIEAMQRSGFDTPHCVWCHDTFAIIVARRSSRAPWTVHARRRDREQS